MKSSILGTGMKFPPQVNPATGRFVMVSDAESVKESIYLILMTQRTERFIRPEFGSNVLSYTFRDTNVTSLTIMRNEILNDIQRNEPRISNIDIEMEPGNNGTLLVNIEYTLIDTQQRDNMVFPFYLQNEFENESEDYEAT